MSKGLYHTVIRRDKGTWIAIRMCDEHELYRAHGDTRDEARKNLRMLRVGEVVQPAFEQR